MIDRQLRKVIEATAKLGGIPPDRIASAIACLEGRGPAIPSGATRKLLTQAEKARQLAVSRFTVRKLVAEGRLHPIELLPGLLRYPADELVSQRQAQCRHN